MRAMTLPLLLLFTGMIVADEEKLKLTQSEQKILELTNAARKKEGLTPLSPNKTLMEVARAHSANMAKQKKVAHKLDDTTPAQRVKKAGYNYRATGENVAAGDPTFTEAEFFQGWMESKGHRENILSSKYNEIGIGIAKDSDGRLYYTQVFGKLLK